MAGRPKARAKRAAELAELMAALGGETTAPAATRQSEAAADDVPGGPDVLVKSDPVKKSDRELMAAWWREQVEEIWRTNAEREERLRSAGEHPNEVFAAEAMAFGAKGAPKEVAAVLLAMPVEEFERWYGREYAIGEAEMVYQVGANLLRIGASTNDRYAVKAAAEVMNRRGGESWRPPAQKLEVTRPEPKARLIDSSKLTPQERGALRAIMLRAVSRAEQEALPNPEYANE